MLLEELYSSWESTGECTDWSYLADRIQKNRWLNNIEIRWNGTILAPNLIKSVFDSDETSEPDDSDDNIEVALDSDIEELLGMKRGDLTRSL